MGLVLKPNVSAGPALAATVANPKTPVVLPTIKSAPKIWGGADVIVEPLRIFMFGQPATGKTYAIRDLLMAGYKVFYLPTDMGGTGLRSFLSSMRKTPEGLEALKLLRGLGDTVFSDVTRFLYRPMSVDPGIWEFDPDFIVWDGYSTYQQLMLLDSIYGGESTGSTERLTENREWSMLKNGTLNSASMFNKIVNPYTGKIIHKIMMAHEDVRNPRNDIASTATPSTDGLPTYTPWLQGSGKQLISGAVDVVIRTGYDKAKKDLDGTLGFRYYLGGSKNKMAKRRGDTLRDFPDDIPGSIMTIVNAVFSDEGITKNMVDPANITESRTVAAEI